MSSGSLRLEVLCLTIGEGEPPEAQLHAEDGLQVLHLTLTRRVPWPKLAHEQRKIIEPAVRYDEVNAPISV